MPPGSGRTLCGDRARCGVEMNGDTHIRSPITRFTLGFGRHAMCVRVYGGCITEKHPRRGRARIRIRRAGEIRATRRAHNEEICIIRKQRTYNVSKSNLKL